MYNGYCSFQNQSYLDYRTLQPSAVKGSANITVDYERRYLLQKLYSVYDFTLPKEWSLSYFRFFLFFMGSIAVIYTHKTGWIISNYSVTKMQRYYLPKLITCYDQWTDSILNGVIGTNAGIIHLLDDYYGMDDLLTRYATQLAEIDKQISVNLMTCGTNYIFWAADKKSGDTIKEVWARASTGEPLVVAGSHNRNGNTQPIESLNPNIKQNYIVSDLLVARRTLINNYLTEIGVNNCNYDKRERLTTAEVEQNDDEIKSLPIVILENLKKDLDAINAISGLGLSVRLRGGDNNAETDVMGDDAMGRNII